MASENIFIREDVAPLLQDIAHFDIVKTLDGEVFREVKNRRTISFFVGERKFFLKYHAGVGWKEIFKNLSQLKLPILGARNEWEALYKLHELGVPTMRVAAYGERGRNPAQRESFLITDALENMESLEDFCPRYFTGPWTPEKTRIKQALIEKMARIAREFHNNGLNHCDMYICHFLLDKSVPLTPEDLQLYIIDLHRVRIRKKVPKHWVMKDLAAIYFSSLDLPLSNSDLFRFIRAYRQEKLEKVLPKEKKFWSQVEQRALKLYSKIFKKEPQFQGSLANS